VALSLENAAPSLKHEMVSAGSSQLLLPWIADLLNQSQLKLHDLDAIAVCIGPGAFTGVRLGIAAAQGLATASNLPVLPVTSLDAIAAQVSQAAQFEKIRPSKFVVAIDARMDEVYWARYESQADMNALPLRKNEIFLSKPEEVDLDGCQYLAGNAITAFGERLRLGNISVDAMDSSAQVSALGVLSVANSLFKLNEQIPVDALEPLYVRNKVALTTQERKQAFAKGFNDGQ
jgi:tRNA threonylcarbamoyladenosine biosynthesis protein TsaB